MLVCGGGGGCKLHVDGSITAATACIRGLLLRAWTRPICGPGSRKPGLLPGPTVVTGPVWPISAALLLWQEGRALGLIMCIYKVSVWVGLDTSSVPVVQQCHTSRLRKFHGYRSSLHTVWVV
jgi:hypothetical protein